jgi:hypothetical protein
MRNYIKHFSLVLILSTFYLSSCVTSQTVNLTALTANQNPVYFTQKPNRPYTEIRHITVEGSVFNSNEAMMKKLISKAKAEGADALVDVKVTYQYTWPRIIGVAVKWD